MTSLAHAAACLLLGAPALALQCEFQVLEDPTPGEDQNFGARVALDGDLAALQRRFGPRSVVVYERGLDGFEIIDEVLDPGSGSTGFGNGIALDGDRLLVGAPFDASLPSAGGVAHVFRRVGASWTLEQTLEGSAVGSNDRFGHDVALVGDVAVVAAPSSGFGTNEAGAVYVFRRGPGDVWSEEQVLTASDGADGDRFGWSIDHDGARIAVGAFRSGPAGAVYVFEGGGPWSETERVTSADAATSGQFGVAVVVDGDRLLVGNNAFIPRGAVHAFDFDGVSWIERQVLEPVGTADDQFGWAIAVDGPRMIVGTADDDTPADNVYSYLDDGATWALEAVLAPDAPQTFGLFGEALALSGDTALIGDGAYDDTAVGSHVGRASVFTFDLADCPALIGKPQSISRAGGGVQTFTINAGPTHAGLPYLLVGSVSYVPGFSFGIPVNGFTVPLTFDAYTLFTATAPNTAPLSDTFGTLDADGAATAAFTVGPDAIPPVLVGITFHHAYVVLTGTTVTFVSNEVPLSIAP